MTRVAVSFRRTWWSLFGLLLVGCLAWAVATPLMASADEGAHAVRAAGVARGQLLPERQRSIIEAWVQHVPEAYALTVRSGCFAYHGHAPEAVKRTPRCVPEFHGSGRLVAVPTYEFRGSPGYYWVVGLPSLVWPDRPGMIAMRVINALALAALVASAFASALHRRTRSFAAVGAIVAFTPMVWYLGGTINPNGTEIAAAIALWTTLLALATEDSDESDARLVTRAGIAAAVLVTMRGVGPGFALVAVIAATLVASPDRIRAVLRRRDTQIWAAVTVVGVVLTVIWTFVVGLTLDQPEHPAIGFLDAVDGLPVILRQSIGAMGVNYLPLPFVVIGGWSVLMAIGIALGLWDTTNRRRLAIGLVALVTVALPITTDGYNVPNIGFPWQGRYGLPLTVGLVILCFWLVDAATRARRTLGAAIVTLALAGQVIAFVAIARRLAMGRVSGANFLDYFSDALWEPGLPSWLLLGAFVVAVVGLGAIVVPAVLAPRGAEEPVEAAAQAT